MSDALREAGGEDHSDLADALGAAYRDCKTQRIEPVATDAIAAAFARGSYNSVPAGMLQRWVVDDGDKPCPDCDDNVLAGGVPRGEPFPTGQQHPPAHTGCKCVLQPERS
jgi:hypothetical protein